VSCISATVNFKELIDIASANLGILTQNAASVKGLTNLDKTPETIEKGILRAKHGLSVYKDGTIRFDATNAPLTHITLPKSESPSKRCIKWVIYLTPMAYL